MPTVSVIIPAFNRTRFLKLAIESACAQTYMDREIIVADDGSDEATQAYLRSIESPMVRVLCLPHSGNPSVVRNAAAAAAVGRYLAFLDSDDEWAPSKLEKQIATLREHPHCRWSFTACRHIDEDGQLIPKRHANPVPAPEGWIFEKLLALEIGIAMPTVVAERSLFCQVGGFDEQQRFGEFHDLCLRLAYKAEVVVVREQLCSVRKHHDHYSGNAIENEAGWLQLYEKIGDLTTTPRQRRIRMRMRAAASLALARAHQEQGQHSQARATLIRAVVFSWRFPKWWWGGDKTNHSARRATRLDGGLATTASAKVNCSTKRRKISVITPCLNSARYITTALESVAVQRADDIEHIVVDGGSTDGSLELLAGYPHLKVLNGPDQGVYDAMNKGLAVAQGEVIGFLNADDSYADGALSFISERFSDPEIMAVAGEGISFRSDAEGGSAIVDHFASAAADLPFASTLGNPAINAWFFRRSVFAKIGGFDVGYRVAGDREFMLRLVISGMRYAAVPRLVYRYRIHSESMTFGTNPQIWDTVTCEHRRMTTHYLQQKKLPNRVRRLIKQARTRDTIRVALRSAKDHNWRGLMDNAAAGSRYDVLWPLRLMKRAIVGRDR